MIKRLLYSLVALLFLCNLSYAQVAYLEEDEIKAAFKEDPGLAAGTKAMYPEPTQKHAAPPKGYKAFYISHYGRHGARTETRSTPYDTMFSFLDQAHKDGALTEYGEDIYSRFCTVYPSLQNSRGDLTVKGQEQHRGIAERMYRNYPSVLKKNAEVYASSSVVPRCVVSMASFMDQLHLLNPNLKITYSANMADMHYNALVYLDYPTSDDLDQLKKTSPFMKKAKDVVRKDLKMEPFFLRICKNMEYVNSHGGLVVASSFWSVANNMQCLDTDVRFDDMFTEEERYQMWQNANLSYAAMVGRTPDTEGLMPQIAQSLLGQILDQAQEDIQTGAFNVRLRFGHDTVVGPLMSILGIEGWTEIVSDPAQIASKVHSFDVPMASNLQFVFYRRNKDHNDILIRLMYNEKDQILPLADQSLAPYYKWEAFKDYYQKVCENARMDLKAAKEKAQLNKKQAQ